MSIYVLLGILWAIWFQVFCWKMLPRLKYLAGQRPIGNDPPCTKPECDFSDFWRAGLTARMPAHGVLQLPQMLMQPGVKMPLPGGYQEGFPYTPPIFLPATAISHLPFELGFFVWTGAWLALAVLLLRWTRLSWPVVVFGLLSPAALWNIELGQLGVIGDALLVAGLLGVVERPLQAGSMLGVLACKPQIGILIPAILLGNRSWRGAAAFFLVCAALVLLTLLVFGWPIWRDYLAGGRRGGLAVLGAPFVPSLAEGGGVSVFWMLRSLHSGESLASAGQVIGTVAAALLTFWIWRRPDLPRLDAVALTVFLSLLATPYGYVDDMVAYSIMLLALAERRGWKIAILDVLFIMWPALCSIVSQQTGVLLTPLIVLLAAARTWWRAGLPVPHLPVRAGVLPRAG